jgi:hypothetical protein
MKKTIFIGGAHRGGKAITETALGQLTGLKVNDVVIADPKEDRALQLAEVWRDRGVRAEGLSEACENAIKRIDADAVVLAIDTIKPMAEILERKPLPTQWQLLARGLGTNGPIVGLAGTIREGISQERASSVKLIDELSSFIMPQSSSNIRENLLNADMLHTMRKRVSQHSIRRLAVIDRDPQDISEGALNLFWGMKMYPLVIRERPVDQRWKEIRQQALQTELTTGLKDINGFATAIVGQKAVDFFVIEPIRGRRIIKFYMPFIHTLPNNTGANLQSIGNGSMLGVIGALALGLGLLMIAAPLAAPAVVTD